MVAGKGAVLITTYEEEAPEVAEPLVRMFELSFDYLGLRFIDRLVVPGAGPKGAVLEMPGVLERAFENGRSLG
jgi:hypothetical protein